MDLALNSLQGLICHKPNNSDTNKKEDIFITDISKKSKSSSCIEKYIQNTTIQN